MNCENCGVPYINDLEKITYRGMEFCSIGCFLNSKYFDISDIEEVSDIKDELECFSSENKKLESELIKEQNRLKKVGEDIGALLESYDDKFETGNQDLDDIMLVLSEIKEECED